jgi:uncharacterized protein
MGGSAAKVLADISHPAHVHFYRAIATELSFRGIEVLPVGRRKDVTEALLEASAGATGALSPPPSTLSVSTSEEVPASATGSRRSAAAELLARARFLRRLADSTGARVLLTRNPSGVLAAARTNVTSVFDTDDGPSVGAHFWLARPFADVITTGDWMPGQFGRAHRRYRGFKALAYLHPARFSPRPLSDVHPALVATGRPLVVVRFSAHRASHDRRIAGIAPSVRMQLLELLGQRSTVVLSEEPTPGTARRSGPDDGAPRVLGTDIRLDPADLLHVLAAADLCVGDSQSVAAEAAMLGVPTIRLSGFTGRAPYLAVLEERYGLMRNLAPGEDTQLLRLVSEALDDLPAWSARSRSGRSRLLAENVDVTGWYADLVEELLDQSR